MRGVEPQSGLLIPQEVAEHLQVHVGTLARWRMEQKGPAWIEVGGQVRYRSEDVQTWLEANKKNGDAHR